MKVERNDCFYQIVGISCIFVYCLPYIILGENAYIQTGDFLDSTIGHLQNIKANGLFFDLGSIIPTMYGVDRAGVVYTSPFELKALLCYLLPMYWGIVANILLVKVTAFVGMFLFLRKARIAKTSWISFLVALIFSFVPFYVDYGITVAGIPLVCWALLNLAKKERTILSLVVSAYYGFYSSMAMGGFAVCLLVAVAIVVLWVREKQLNIRLIVALALIGLAYVAIDFHTIFSFLFDNDFVSHRTARDDGFFSLNWKLKYIATLVWKNSPPHFGRCIIVQILLAFGVTTIVYWNKEKHLRQYLTGYIVLYVIIAIAYLLPFLPWSIFKAFDFSRITAFYLPACFILLAVTLDVLIRHNKKMLAIVLLVLTMVGVELETTNTKWGPRDHFSNVMLLFGGSIDYPTYRQFYDTELFSCIAHDLCVRQDYTTKVVSVGLSPAEAEYNGFYCLDGYFMNYSIDHMYDMCEVNQYEFSKDGTLARPFYHGHNKCFVVSTELGVSNFHYRKDDPIAIHHLATNTNKLRDMGCEYLFSSVEIKNYKDLELTYIGSYTTDKSFYNIRVYKL